jgi:hypothetical protein
MTTDDALHPAGARRIEYGTLALGAAGALVAGIVWGWQQSGALGLGAALSWLNFRWLKQGVLALSSAATARPGVAPARVHKSVYVKFFARYALLLAALYVILAGLHWPVMPFLCGLFAVVAAVLMEMIYELACSWGRPGPAA